MKAIIVGLGNIAWKFESGPGCIRNHYDALKGHGFEYIAGVDPDESARLAYQKKTGQSAYSSLGEALERMPSVDLVSITSPSELHFEQCSQSLKARVPRIWLEKPAATRWEEIKKLIDLQSATQSKIVVNYLRRFSPPYLELKRSIQSKKWGELKSLTLNYSRDIMNNGVHMIDLLGFLTSESEVKIECILPGKNPSVIGKIQNCPFFLIGHEVDYHNLDVTLTMEHGRLSVLHGGKTMVVERQVKNDEFPLFSRLETSEVQTFETTGSDFPEALRHLMEEGTHSHSGLKESLYIAEFLKSAGVVP